MTYLITFSCYGSHLPGDARGSFDHVRRGERREIAPSAALEAYHRGHLRQTPFVLESSGARSAVRGAIIDVCTYRSWLLHALHVRTNHVHGVVEADASPSRILGDWKAYASRALHAVEENRIFWTHGGNARRIQTREARMDAIRYVVEGQGEPMEIWTPLTPP